MTASTRHVPQTNDAIVFVPGIMGSELVDPDNNDIVWGLKPRLLERFLLTGSIFDKLRNPNLQPGEILKVRCFLPILGGFDPYTRLMDVLRKLCRHPDAFVAYPYDWRQSVADTAAGLADLAAAHIEKWRKHPQGSSGAKVVVVAHSMGGLVSRYATSILMDPDDTDMILTLGTPFGGSVKSVQAMGHGDFLPLGIRSGQFKALVRELPAMYDLLPSYPSLTTDPEAPDTATRPTVSDFIAIGADKSLAELAESNRTKVKSPTESKAPTIVPLSGSAQPTLQSYTVNDGQPDCHDLVDGHDWGGDGTVYAGASYLKGQTPYALPQQHGPIAKSPEGLNWVKHVIQHLTIGPPMGDGIGLHVPTIATAGEPIPITITHENLGGIALKIQSITGRQLRTPRLIHTGASDYTTVTLPEGLYTIAAQGGGFSEVTSDVLVNPKTAN